MTDEEIKSAIDEYFETEFVNFGGDTLSESLDGEDDSYDRAIQLLDQAVIRIVWQT